MAQTYTKTKDSLDRIDIVVYGETLTLPLGYEVAEGVRKNKVPLTVRNSWFDFLFAGNADNPGNVDDPLDGEVHDLGDGFCCFREPSDINAAGCQLKVYTDSNAAVENYENIIQFMGLDAAGNYIRTNTSAISRDGEALDLLASPGYATMTNSFARLTQVVKPLTQGVLRVYAINPADSSENLIAIYQPSERTPNYRRYKVPKSNDGSNTYTATVLSRKRFIEAVQDNDPIGLDHFGALYQWVLYVDRRDAKDRDGAKDALAAAQDILSRQAVRNKPASQYPPPIIDMDEAQSVPSWPGY